MNDQSISTQEKSSIELQKNSSYFSMEKFTYMQRMAETLIKSSAMPSQFENGSQVVAAMQYGWELGYKPMESLQCIAIVNGRFTLHSQEGIARITRAGWKIEWKESTNDKCIMKISKDGDDHEETYTIEDAKNSSLTSKDNWRKYPKIMLRYKAAAMHRKFNIPEVMGSFHTADEAEEMKPINVTVKDDISTADFKKVENLGSGSEIKKQSTNKDGKTVIEEAELKEVSRVEETSNEELKEQVNSGEKTMSEAMSQIKYVANSSGVSAKEAEENATERLKNTPRKSKILQEIEEAAKILEFNIDPEDEDWSTVVEAATGKAAKDFDKFKKKDYEALHSTLSQCVDLK